jgi:hypothetical protein
VKKSLVLASSVVLGWAMPSGVASASSDTLGAVPLSAPGSTTTRVSVSSSGQQSDLPSYPAGISANGRYVALSSEATNLVAGDTNGAMDVFVHDRKTGQTTRVSVSSSGRQGSDGSEGTGISANGRYVAFTSSASNLVAGDTNDNSDVFVHDRRTGQTTRVSVSSSGRQGNSTSGFGAISADGRYVAFASLASNLVAGDSNGGFDVFVRDRTTGRTIRVSVGRRGQQANGDSEGPAISAHGRYVAFTSAASNLVPGDTNRLGDVFAHDRRTGTTQRVSVTSRGNQAEGSPTGNGSNAATISANGRDVAFHSDDTNLVPADTNDTNDMFVHDRWTGRTTRVSISSNGSQANGESLGTPIISADGRYVAFDSLASNLVAGDTNDITDVFLHDRCTGQTILVSLGSSSNQGNDGSFIGGTSARGITANDRTLAFTSFASNLVGGDTNNWPDAFVRELG